MGQIVMRTGYFTMRCNDDQIREDRKRRAFSVLLKQNVRSGAAVACNSAQGNVLEGAESWVRSGTRRGHVSSMASNKRWDRHTTGLRLSSSRKSSRGTGRSAQIVAISW